MARPGAIAYGRFIPACVGNAVAGLPSSTEQQVHPRVCGERSHSPTARPRLTGSSPRVWGTPGFAPPLTRSARFIPACVGNASFHASPRSYRAVHPRVCGERTAGDVAAALPSGSSPRVWGTRSAVKPNRASIGGSSPRVWGTPEGRRPALRLRHGSSPRVWGTPRVHSSETHYGRFIPACVGNAWCCPAPTALLSVHPRVCGERNEALHINCNHAGSSPRVWGTRSGVDAVGWVWHGSSPRVWGTPR